MRCGFGKTGDFRREHKAMLADDLGASMCGEKPGQGGCEKKGLETAQNWLQQANIGNVKRLRQYIVMGVVNYDCDDEGNRRHLNLEELKKKAKVGEDEKREESVEGTQYLSLENCKQTTLTGSASRKSVDKSWC